MTDEAPYRNFNFRVEIEGVEAAGFSEVVVPEAEVAVVEYREGGDRELSVRKLPGLVRYGNVVLKRGISRDLTLYQWFRAIVRGDLQRRDVAIVLADREHEPVRRWLVRGAWPCKYEGPALNAKSNEVAIETLELACESIEIDG
jgi:phage tail-like protein